jgi:carboxylesterase
MTDALIPGAEAWSHEGAEPVGVLVIHGFTGNPSSMRGMAEACAAAGLHVELP